MLIKRAYFKCRRKIRINKMILEDKEELKPLFFLNKKPRKNTEYLILADGIIKAELEVMS